jgi:hypothetical protein
MSNTSDVAEAPPEKLLLLAEDKKTSVRQSVAKNQNCPADVLSFLAQDVEVRREVAEHPSTPAEVLVALSQDEDRDVRWCVAEHPNTPQETLQLLVEDENFSPAFGAARNPNVPAHALRRLLERFSDNREGRAWQGRAALAKNPSAPPDLLDFLAQDEDYRVRRAVAQNPNATPAVFSRLARDKTIGCVWRSRRIRMSRRGIAHNGKNRAVGKRCPFRRYNHPGIPFPSPSMSHPCRAKNSPSASRPSPRIREAGYYYVDKTAFALPMIEEGVGSGLSWALAIALLASIREKLKYSDVPVGLRGLGITFIILGLMSLGFMSFSGVQL